MIRVEIPIRFISESPNPEASLYLMFRSPKIHLYSRGRSANKMGAKKGAVLSLLSQGKGKWSI